MEFKFVSEIIELIQAGETVICCESPIQERKRLLSNIAQYCSSNHVKCHLWNLGQETVKEVKYQFNNFECNINKLVDYTPVEIKETKDYFSIFKFWNNYQKSGILVVENLCPWIGTNPPQETEFFITSEWIKSNLINIAQNSDYSGNKCLIILGHKAELHPELAAEIPLIVQDLPDINEILDFLSESKFILPNSLNEQELITIARSCVGLYISDIVKGLRLIIKKHPQISTEKVVEYLLEYKIDLLNKLYEIEFIRPPKVPLGGLDLMQEAFKKFKRLLSPLAKAYKLKVPKGILLVGPPGTGKSHSAKVCSQVMGIPLILVDWGNFRGYGNEAERKLKDLLKLADKLNEVLLYFDDFDKGFAGDDDLGRRLAGQLLTWMQERTSDVIVIASANRMEWLPPELTRSGRFDYIYKVDLPNYGERHAIFKLHGARFDNRFRNGGDPYTKDEWRRLLKETHRCVGAEIQTIVERAAATTFYQMFPEDVSFPEDGNIPPLEISIATLLEERRQINPLAIREADRVESMRNKADLQGLPSSPLDESIYAIGNVDIFDN